MKEPNVAILLSLLNAEKSKKWSNFKKNWVIANLGRSGQINWADYFESVHQKYTVFISSHLLFISCKYVL